MNFKTSIFAPLVVIVLSTTPLLSQQQEEGTGIEERLSLYLPIFQSPHCSNYLTDFGDPEKQVSNYAKTIGLDDPSLLKPKDAAGTYFHMYQEPDPLVNMAIQILNGLLSAQRAVGNVTLVREAYEIADLMIEQSKNNTQKERQVL